MSKSGLKPFDPKAFDRMRGDIKQQQAMDAAKSIADKKSARMNPKAPVKPEMVPLTERIVFGAKSRKERANRGGY